jgi:hypothetical protein
MEKDKATLNQEVWDKIRPDIQGGSEVGRHNACVIKESPIACA